VRAGPTRRGHGSGVGLDGLGRLRSVDLDVGLDGLDGKAVDIIDWLVGLRSVDLGVGLDVDGKAIDIIDWLGGLRSVDLGVGVVAGLGGLRIRQGRRQLVLG